MNTIIEQVVTGDISMECFLEELQNCQNLQNYIRSLLPDEAKDNSFHPFWKIVPYESLRYNQFDYFKFLFWGLHSKNKWGKNLSIFSRISKLYLFHFPQIQCTNRYEEEFDLYLDVINDCCDGPEVTDIVEKVIQEALPIKGKGNRKKAAKSVMVESFHITDGKRPRWIQGPEWPMGSMSPMKFRSQKRKGEQVEYTFEDIDTGAIRVIKQFY